MKKFLKKLGVFGLICAVLSPFASIPKVNAEEDCEHYLNQYLFLDVTTGNYWEHYLKRSGSRTYTTFLYTFPELAEGQTLKIDKVGSLNLVDDDYKGLENFYANWEKALAPTVKNRTLENQTERLGIADEYTYYTGDYESITYILHGYWGFEDEKYEESTYTDDEYKEIKENYETNTIQGVLINKEKEDSDFNYNKFKYKVDFSGASLENDKFTPVYNQDYNGFDSDMDDYFNQIVTDVNDGFKTSSKSYQDGYVWKAEDDDNNYYFNIGISRTIDSTSQLDKLYFGYNSQIWTTNKDSFTDSYTAFSNYANYCVDTNKDKKCDGVLAKTVDESQPEGDYCTGTYECYLKAEDADHKIDINNGEQYYWPVILNVEYSLCSNVADDGGDKDDGGNTGTHAKQKWTLKYKEGKDVAAKDVTNMPSSEEAEIKTAITVTDKKPKRDGYAFQDWKLCDGNDSTVYKSGDKITSEKATTIELCAQWGKEGSEDNPKQGVISYVIGFAAVGVVAGAIYLISKKKNLFKQI